MFSIRMAQELPFPARYPPLLHPPPQRYHCRDLLTAIPSLHVPYPFSFLPYLERKTSVDVGREERAVFAFQRSEEVGR
jgi:hypothetical protein